LRFLDHTKLHTHPAGIFWTTDQLVAETAPSQCKQTQETNIHALSWIRNCDPRPRAAADLHLRSHGHRDWREVVLGATNYQGRFHQSSKRKTFTTELGVKM